MVAKRGKQGGANCTLSYVKGSGKSAQTLAYRVRAASVAHGVQQIATESHGRSQRAYYPHRRTQAQFQVTFLLLGRTTVVGGTSEFIRFNTWMGDYMRFLLEQDEFADQAIFPQMTVTIPSRGFMRRAIPLGPLQYGEHVGSALWTQSINFETVFEPRDAAFNLSSFKSNGSENDINAKFFYPSSPLQSGNQRPDVYDGVVQTIDIAGGGGIVGGLGVGVPKPADVQAATTGSPPTLEPTASTPPTEPAPIQGHGGRLTL